MFIKSRGCIRLLFIVFPWLFLTSVFAKSKIKEVRILEQGKFINVKVFDGRFVVNFANRDTSRIHRVLSDYGLHLEEFLGLNNWAYVTADVPFETLETLREQNPDLVSEVEFDFVLQKFSAPNDSLFATQWYLNDSLGFDIDWLEAYPLTAGNHPVIVGILDTGLAAEFNPVTNEWTHHPDLPGFDILVPGKDYSEENEGEGLAAIRDLDGHGTFVAGEIFAKTNNGSGISGLLGHNRLVSGIIHQIFNAEEGVGPVSRIAAAIKDLVDRGVSVINLSGGGFGYSGIMEDAVAYASQRDVILVVSAGNADELGVAYPARFSRIGVKNRTGYANVISVGATDRHDRKASFSSYGPELCFMAPGERTFPVSAHAPEDEIGVISTTPWYQFYAEGSDWKRNYHDGGRGTSFAAPIVTALVASLLSHDPGLSPRQIVDILIDTSDKVGDREYEWDGQGSFNAFYGYGRINFQRALLRVTDFTTSVEQTREDLGPTPDQFRLFQNYPNPFNPTTKIRFSISEAMGRSSATLVIYNSLGQHVRKLVAKNLSPGVHSVEWDGRDDRGQPLASGVYVYQFQARAHRKTRTMILLK